MPRPKCCRRVAATPRCVGFLPEGGAMDEEAIALELEELEALRLADREGLYQDAAAAQMQVSRQTFGRILSAARRKVATALLDGRALRLASDASTAAPLRRCGCGGHGGETDCPRCRSAETGENEQTTGCRRRRGWFANTRSEGEQT